RERVAHKCHEGSALVTVMVVLAVLFVLLAAFMQLVGAAHKEQTQIGDDTDVQYAAEAGLAESYLALEQGQDPTQGSSADDPLEFRGVHYWVESQDLGTRVYALRATAEERRARKRIELVVRQIPNGFFRYAVFGADGVTFDTSSFVDSYDSSLGSYASQYD